MWNIQKSNLEKCMLKLRKTQASVLILADQAEVWCAPEADAALPLI